MDEWGNEGRHVCHLSTGAYRVLEYTYMYAWLIAGKKHLINSVGEDDTLYIDC